jgi:TusA-related sulfurtransferase
MNKLIVICSNENEANHLAFLASLLDSSILPYYEVKHKELITPNAVGGFITIMNNPYPDNVIELKESLKSLPIGNKLIMLTFDTNGICNEIKHIVDEMNIIFLKHLTNYQQNNKHAQVSIKSELRKMFDTCGLTLEKGFDFDIINTSTKPVIKALSNPFELFLDLTFKYRNNN